MRLTSLILEPGADLLNSLVKIAQHDQGEGYVLSVVGDLSSASFKCPNQSEITTLKGHFEIITLGGTISASKTHLHICISDNECNLKGGHLEYGALVLKGAQILLGFLDSKSDVNSEKFIDRVLNKIDVYILEGCPWSKRAIRLLNQLSIKHNIIVVNDDLQFQELYFKSNSRTFPQVFINDSYLGGYDYLVKMNERGQLKSLK